MIGRLNSIKERFKIDFKKREGGNHTNAITSLEKVIVLAINARIRV